VLHADQILVMEDGQVVDRGRHKDLLDRGGLYERLYQMQFRDAPAGALGRQTVGYHVAATLYRYCSVNRGSESSGPKPFSGVGRFAQPLSW
jgi:hypothetical protein